MSIETTQARGKLQDAIREWARHCRICAQCKAAGKRAKWDALCTQGFVAHDDLRLARRELAEQLELDSRPAPGQLRLL